MAQCYVLYTLPVLLQITAWSRILFEALLVAQLLTEYLVFHGNRSFITVITRVASCPYLEPN